MKNLTSNLANGSFDTTGISHTMMKNLASYGYGMNDVESGKKVSLRGEQEDNYLYPQAVFQMATGQIPDLWEYCYSWIDSLKAKGNDFSMQDVFHLMHQIESLNPDQVKSFLKNPESRHVLIQTPNFKLVLIYWKPGKVSDIHGHDGTGCVFRLLAGRLEELRFTPDTKQDLIGNAGYRKGDMAYIDDQLAYHQVGNPFGTSAISIHAYLRQGGTGG